MNIATGGLSLDQAPALSVPASFFITIPIGIFVAAGILMTNGALPLISPWLPQALALTHTGTLGVLAMGMMGALYQMTPVVAGTPVPFTRLAHLVHVLLVTALAGFLWRLLGGPEAAMTWAITFFKLALVGFILPLGWTLVRPATHNETVQGMRVAVISLAVVTLTGVLMAGGYAGGLFAGQRVLWMQVHLSLALLGWVGGLIMAVSWQVIPMFYLAPVVSKTTTRWFLSMLLVGLVLPLAMLLVSDRISGMVSPARLVAVCTLPAVLVIWLLHPILILRKISQRKRKRQDASLLFWKTGLICALLISPVAVAAVLLDDPRWQVLFGWLSIWGWAGLIMHGMLSRIVPFLVWFHHYSSKVGLEPVPSMRSLLSQRRINTGFALHTGSLVMGAAAIIVQGNILARLTGLLLLATSVSLASMLLHVLIRKQT